LQSTKDLKRNFSEAINLKEGLKTTSAFFSLHEVNNKIAIEYNKKFLMVYFLGAANPLFARSSNNFWTFSIPLASFIS